MVPAQQPFKRRRWAAERDAALGCALGATAGEPLLDPLSLQLAEPGAPLLAVAVDGSAAVPWTTPSEPSQLGAYQWGAWARGSALTGAPWRRAARPGAAAPGS
jgi:hypothetical protein